MAAASGDSLRIVIFRFKDRTGRLVRKIQIEGSVCDSAAVKNRDKEEKSYNLTGTYSGTTTLTQLETDAEKLLTDEWAR